MTQNVSNEAENIYLYVMYQNFVRKAVFEKFNECKLHFMRIFLNLLISIKICPTTFSAATSNFHKKTVPYYSFNDKTCIKSMHFLYTMSNKKKNTKSKCYSPWGVACVCQGEVPNSEIIHLPQNCQTAVYRMTSLHPYQTSNFLVSKSFPNTCNK